MFLFGWFFGLSGCLGLDFVFWNLMIVILVDGVMLLKDFDVREKWFKCVVFVSEVLD